MDENAYTPNTCDQCRPQLMPLWCLSASGGEPKKHFLSQLEPRWWNWHHEPRWVHGPVPRVVQGTILPMHYVYILQSIRQNNDGLLYTGRTDDLRRRINEHKTGNVHTTKRMLPIRLVFYECFLDKNDAIRREQYLKTTKGKSTLRLMLRHSLML